MRPCPAFFHNLLSISLGRPKKGVTSLALIVPYIALVDSKVDNTQKQKERERKNIIIIQLEQQEKTNQILWRGCYRDVMVMDSPFFLQRFD